MHKQPSPAGQISDQCISLQCWAGSLDFQGNAGEIRRPAGRKKNTVQTKYKIQVYAKMYVQ